MLSLDTDRSPDWIEQLSSLVDLETISQVRISRASPYGPGILEVDDVGRCLHLMPNLQSLIILCDSLTQIGFVSSSQPSIMPSSVRHLTLTIYDFKDCMRVLERFDQLWTFMWHFRRELNEKELRTLNNWLDENRPGSHYEYVRGLIHIWLGKERLVSRNKRRKHDL